MLLCLTPSINHADADIPSVDCWFYVVFWSILVLF